MQSCKSGLLVVALLIMTHPMQLVHCIKVKACLARFTILTTLIARATNIRFTNLTSLSQAGNLAW